MFNFESLIQSVQQHRQNAATFYKVDLHIHSFESHDFPKLGDKNHCTTELIPLNYEKSSQHFINFAKQVDDLRVIAITDHNVSRMSAEIAKLSDQAILALPGMEATLQATIFPDSKIHILAIFPEGHASEDIQNIFPLNCGMPPYEQRTKDSVAQITVEEFIKRVHEARGICIAGHVNSDKGMRTLFKDYNVRQLETRLKIEKLKHLEAQGKLTGDRRRQLEMLEAQVKELEDDMQNRYLEFLSKHEFDAVEVKESTDNQYYSGVHTSALGIKPIPCVIGSDAHNLQDIGLKGSTTYIKMQTPSFRDLKRALRDPVTRIRYEDTVPCFNVPRILGVRFSGGFFKTYTIGFSDNLTCLIGGRGSGKSATIEALRYVFQHELVHLTGEKRSDIDNRRSHTLHDTVMEILFADQNNDLFVLRRDYAASQTECFDVNGERMKEVDVATASNLDVKIYGWGEIEELARNKREQLRLIDGFIQDIQPLHDVIHDCVRTLENNMQEIISLAKDIEELLPKIDELPQKEAALARLSTDEVNAIFEDYDRNEVAKTAMQSLEKMLSDLQSRFQDDKTSEPFDLLQEIETALNNVTDKLVKYNWSGPLKASLQQEAQKLDQIYKSLLAQFNEIKNLLEGANKELIEEREDINNELNKKIASEDAGDLSTILVRRRQLSSEVAELRNIKDEINNKRTRINELLAHRNDTLMPALDNARNVVTRLRKEKIQEINKRLEFLSSAVKVSLDLQAQGDRENFRLKLGAPEDKAPDGILKNVYRFYKRDNYAGHYSRLHTPRSFVQAIINPGDYSSLQVKVEEREGEIREIIDIERAKAVVQHLSPYLKDTDNQFDSDKLQQMLELEHLEIEDWPIIKLDGKSIEDLSPGQRCSTLIPIILLENTSPLIIDQPEDNLDNKLVFDLVVDILRSLKQQRQIIVATHNPNIPVSGDAEQIIVYETVSREECEISDQGSIDDEKIVEKIKAIMEGSEDAFRIRAEKYGYRLSIMD